MQLTVEMPWEKNLSVNDMRFGKGGHYRKKPEVQAWMALLAQEINKAAQAAGLEYKTRYWKGGLRFELLSPELVRLPVEVLVDFRWPDKRRHDTHNYFKGICDSVAKGLGIDDKDIGISAGTAEIDENAGFTITVSDDA